MNRRLYSLLLILLLPLVMLYFIWRSRNNPGYRHRLTERIGFNTPKVDGVILVHCASVGETLAAAPLIRALRKRYPAKSLLVTSTTPNGSEQVQKSFGDNVAHCYLPLDLSGVTRRFLTKLKPCMVVLMETELWPNLIHHCHHQNVPVLLSNARMSERSAKRYSKYPKLTDSMLKNLSAVAVQNADDGSRLVELGLEPSKLTICGSLKFDIDIDDEHIEQLKKQRQSWVGERPAWCAGSTHPGEFELALAAHQALLRNHPDLLLILVPRHPEQFEPAFKLSRASNLVTKKRSETPQVGEQVQVVIGDTMGELLSLYGMSDATFVGGSLIDRGGHNPLEPAALAKPVLMGPHFFNFEEIGNTLINAGGMTIVRNQHELADELEHLISLGRRAAQMGNQGQQVVEVNRGATERQLALASALVS